MIIGLDIDGTTVKSMAVILAIGNFARFFTKKIAPNRRAETKKAIYDIAWNILEMLHIFFPATNGASECFQYAQKNNIQIVFISARPKRWLLYTIRQINKIVGNNNFPIILSDKTVAGGKPANLKKYAGMLDIFVDDTLCFLKLINKKNSGCKTVHFLSQEAPFICGSLHYQIKNLVELISLIEAKAQTDANI